MTEDITKRELNRVKSALTYVLISQADTEDAGAALQRCGLSEEQAQQVLGALSDEMEAILQKHRGLIRTLYARWPR